MVETSRVAEARHTLDIIRSNLVNIASGVVRALEDDKISTIEAIQLGTVGLTSATQIVAAIQALDGASAKEVLAAIEAGQI